MGKQHLSGRPVPLLKNQAGSSSCDPGHGGQVGSTGLSHAALWDTVCRSRSRLLCGGTPSARDQLAQTQSRQPGDSKSLMPQPPRTSFWRVENAILPSVLARARTSAEQDLQLASMLLGGGPCLRRTAHPFVASGPQERICPAVPLHENSILQSIQIRRQVSFGRSAISRFHKQSR